MSKPCNSQYDAVIIGAGIGGLVCGCYLAKSGLKVLMTEQHYQPGGYCTSFARKNYTFDAAAHCFGGYRKDGLTRKVLDYLEVEKKIAITRFNPSDIIVTPDYKVSFCTDLNETIGEFRSAFPKEEGNIRKFFQFILNPEANSFARIRSWTFETLLDQFFVDNKLKSVLSIPLLGNGGLPPSHMSAFIGAKLISEFLLDGGYYPGNKIQDLPDALAERFSEFGGELRLSTRIKKIKVNNNSVEGLVTETDDFISSRYIVSNCDARQTFLNLIDNKILPVAFYDKINNMLPSSSDFLLYLGINPELETLPKPGTSLWFLSHYDLDRAYHCAQNNDIDGFGGYMLRVSSDRTTVLAIIPASFQSKQYWQDNKITFQDALIQRIEKHSIPNLSKYILYKESATPQTLSRYTSNYRGASYGWAGTPSQLADPELSKPSFIRGLFLAGHWTTLGVGISGVIYSGLDTANLILRKEKLPIN